MLSDVKGLKADAYSCWRCVTSGQIQREGEKEMKIKRRRRKKNERRSAHHSFVRHHGSNMKSNHLLRDGTQQIAKGRLGQIRNANPQHTQARQVRKDTMYQVPGTIPQIESLQFSAPPQELRHALEQGLIVVMSHHDESEILEMREERMSSVDDMIASEDDAG